MFRITDNKGFHITFDNGFTVSVQFGPGNYSDNYDANWDTLGQPQSSRTAETAVFSPDGEFVAYRGQDVQGHMTAEQVLDLMNQVSQLNWAEQRRTLDPKETLQIGVDQD